MTDNSGYQGKQRPSDSSGAYNAQLFLIRQTLNKINTSALVEVISCSNSGGLSPVGVVSVKPMVHQVDGQGNPVSHGEIFNLPYVRIQGGANAIILDPEPGDIGIASFCSRDISVVQKNKSPALPGSERKYDMADGIYIGGVLNAAPQQYIQFTNGGITISSPSTVTVNSPSVTVNASDSFHIVSPTTTITGNLIVSGSITGQQGSTIATDIVVNGKINATGPIESASSLKVGGVTLNVP